MIVEDDRRYAGSLSSWLDERGRFGRLTCFGSVEEAEAAIENVQPDVILLDLHLPGAHGAEGVRRFRDRLPTARILLLSVSDNYDEVFEALTAGADGYLLKSEPPDRILQGIRDAIEGGAPLSPPIARMIVRSLGLKSQPSTPVPTTDHGDNAETQLTKRETEIIEMIASGLVYKEVGDKLGISRRTVESHARSIYQKLQAKGKREAVALWKNKR
jgi:DNA-binding NarL/FixJ family response regulator